MSAGGEGASLLTCAWSALGEDPAALKRVPPGGEPALTSALNVPRLARDAVAAASLAAALWTDSLLPRGRPRAVHLDAGRIATAFTSERHLRLRGVSPDLWAPLSGFWEAADGWVRTHANYPHHRGRLLAALELATGAGPDELAARIRSAAARDIEHRVYAAGGIAAAVRPAGQGLADWGGPPDAPPLALTRLGPAPARFPGSPDATAAAPLRGLRVLDLTRVIAGPVATRTLALLGADVLRIDSPALPEMPVQHLDTGAGKRTALLDLSLPADERTFRRLLDGAHVVVTGYRPGALDRFGLEPAALAGGRPGIILARLSAWGNTGPWAQRRGFDSIVQAVSGIAMRESPDGVRPGVLPAQALDHAAGYLLAAGVLSALRRQQDEGSTWLLESSLAGIAAGLLQDPRPLLPPLKPGPPTVVVSPDGITTALPALAYDEGPEDWPFPARPWGADPPDWVLEPAAQP
ncbi:CoA transferase [Arthrobacter crusticola]|uniref:CoA transferase n=1 Tax=Arthrobacter crusticola TaxID=2547960 RepID=A0A4R5TLT7_9MICC|nr:CoA transferase [Arthrobacter crusticola]TDK23527.1 CoA transferase [Arthrobacter crusticola]